MYNIEHTWHKEVFGHLGLNCKFLIGPKSWDKVKNKKNLYNSAKRHLYILAKPPPEIQTKKE